MSGKTSLLLGAHFSIAKGLHNALYIAQAYNCSALQIFTKNAHTWRERTLSSNEIDLFDQARERTGINAIASHTSYLINLATYEKKTHDLSRQALKHELFRSSLLGIPFVVLHPGAHRGRGENAGIRQITDSINNIFKQTKGLKTRLLLETTAGQGSGTGHSFEQFKYILARVDNNRRLGFCLDTCHIFAAGYDIRTSASYRKTINAFDDIIGLEHLCLIHLNDSKKKLGSKVDRHEHIGEGYIGINAFKLFMNDDRFHKIPKIIETPKEKGGKDYDKINLDRLRKLVLHNSDISPSSL
jgi:deoxyribonuclease-4